MGTEQVDEATLQFVAGSRLEIDPERLVPTGARLSTVGTPCDFRVAREIGSQVLDDCFTDLARDERTKAHVRLRAPASGRSTTIWMNNDYRYVQVFTGDTLIPNKRRCGLAIEPMTCPPNAFRTGVDLIVLHPGEAVNLEWGISTT